LSEPRQGADLHAVAVLMAGACVIGFSPILVRLTQTGPAAAAFWRLAFALPILGVSTRRSAEGLKAPSRLALLAGLFFALDLGFWHYGVKYTSVGLATVLSNLTPIVVTAVAWLVLKQRPRRLFLLAVAVALAGAWLMASQRRGAPGLDPPLGNLLSVTTALWYGLYMVVAQARRREGASALMFWSSVAGLPLVLIAALALGERIVPTGPSGWAACVGLGLVHAGGQGAIAWAMGRLPPATASVVVLVQPVVAALLAWAVFQEPVTPLQALGGAVALGGVVLAQWASRGEAAVSPPGSAAGA
jgi:drug/metabolite transporter (DMT)-like permease